MKTQLRISSRLTLACLLLLLFAGCTKTGPAGTNGTNGTNGTDGTNGTNGTNGTDGATILSGTTDPDSSVGNVGDYYLNLATDSLFGPKTASGWGTGIGLKGATGTANVIYSDWNYASNTRDSSIDGSYDAIQTLAAPSLTAADLSTATILVYFKFGTTVIPLPYTSYAGGIGNVMSFIPEVGQIIITRWTFNNTASTGFAALLYRFVIIPGGANVTDGFRKAANNMHYNAIE